MYTPLVGHIGPLARVSAGSGGWVAGGCDPLSSPENHRDLPCPANGLLDGKDMAQAAYQPTRRLLGASSWDTAANERRHWVLQLDLHDGCHLVRLEDTFIDASAQDRRAVYQGASAKSITPWSFLAMFSDGHVSDGIHGCRRLIAQSLGLLCQNLPPKKWRLVNVPRHLFHHFFLPTRQHLWLYLKDSHHQLARVCRRPATGQRLAWPTATVRTRLLMEDTEATAELTFRGVLAGC